MVNISRNQLLTVNSSNNKAYKWYAQYANPEIGPLTRSTTFSTRYPYSGYYYIKISPADGSGLISTCAYVNVSN